MFLFKSREVPAENDAEKQYSRLMGIIHREVQNIYAYDACVQEWSEEKILEMQLLYLAGLKKVFLRDVFYEHVIRQIEAGEIMHLPEVYPWESWKDLDEEDLLCQRLKDKCILMTYRKSYSVADQIKRVKDGDGLTGQRCYMFKHLEIGFTSSGGNHRIIAANMMGYDIEAPLTVINDEPLVKNLNTDGRCWYSAEGRPVGDVYDYRIAIIFTLTKALISGDISLIN